MITVTYTENMELWNNFIDEMLNRTLIEKPVPHMHEVLAEYGAVLIASNTIRFDNEKGYIHFLLRYS
jgi:Iap family predicted aminopeptidase